MTLISYMLFSWILLLISCGLLACLHYLKTTGLFYLKIVKHLWWPSKHIWYKLFSSGTSNKSLNCIIVVIHFVMNMSLIQPCNTVLYCCKLILANHQFVFIVVTHLHASYTKIRIHYIITFWFESKILWYSWRNAISSGSWFDLENSHYFQSHDLVYSFIL